MNLGKNGLKTTNDSTLSRGVSCGLKEEGDFFGTGMFIIIYNSIG